MAGAPRRLPNGFPGGDDPIPPQEVYKVAVDEYRFQTQHNWSRTQYLLAFNAAVLTAGSAVASRPGRAAALVFLLGVVCAPLSALAMRTQHAYYRAARDRLRRIEDTYGVPIEHRIDTTSTMGERPGRKVSVTQVIYLLFGALAAANAVGIAIIVFR